MILPTLVLHQSLFICLNDQDIRSLRRHCCALLIKLSTKFPGVLMSAFQFLHLQIDQLNSRGIGGILYFFLFTFSYYLWKYFVFG